MSPPADVPVFLHVDEMVPLPRVAHVRQLLGPGRRLLVEVDVDRGIQINVPFDNHLFRVAAGAIRLAAMAGAELIPCLIVETASWNYTIHFGNPVSGHYLGNSPDLEAAAAHFAEGISKSRRALSGAMQRDITIQHLAVGRGCSLRYFL